MSCTPMSSIVRVTINVGEKIRSEYVASSRTIRLFFQNSWRSEDLSTFIGGIPLRAEIPGGGSGRVRQNSIFFILVMKAVHLQLSDRGAKR